MKFSCKKRMNKSVGSALSCIWLIMTHQFSTDRDLLVLPILRLQIDTMFTSYVKYVYEMRNIGVNIC